VPLFHVVVRRRLARARQSHRPQFRSRPAPAPHRGDSAEEVVRMRIYMGVQIPAEAGNEAIKKGVLANVMNKFIDTHRPESAYFLTVNGERCAHFYFDLKDVSLMPVIAEPFFIELCAKVTYCPAMNPEDLKKGLHQLMGAAAVMR
jgi:hypothetical protein